jgi:mitochondrial chaperone BCS1
MDLFTAHSSLINPVSSSMLMLGAVGWLGYLLRAVPAKLWTFFRRVFILHLEVDNRSECFMWLDLWLARQNCGQKGRSLRLQQPNRHRTVEEPEAVKPWHLSASFGVHFFRWRHRLLYLHRFLESKGNSQMPLEVIHLDFLGRSQKLVQELVQEAFALYTAKAGAEVYRLEDGRYWARVVGKMIRPLDSIYLEPGQVERLVADMRWFWSAADWYVQRGIPWRRGYLFAGPPGTGKSSLAAALAGALDMPLQVINLGSLSMDDQLSDALHDTKANSVVLLEDIDCLAVAGNREAEGARLDQGGRGTGITRAGLLNILDGVLSPEGRIIIMTTNFPERLDTAMLRPGRADIRVDFQGLDAAGQERMAKAFYGPGQFKGLPERIVQARLQGTFMEHPQDAGAARKVLMLGAPTETQPQESPASDHTPGPGL